MIYKLQGSFMRTSCWICVKKELASCWKTNNFIKTLVYVIGQFYSQSCLLFIFKYHHVSTECCTSIIGNFQYRRRQFPF